MTGIPSQKPSAKTPTARPSSGPLKTPAPTAPAGKAAGTDRLEVTTPAQNGVQKGFEDSVVKPINYAVDFWRQKAKQGGATGVAGKVMGVLLDFSGIPSIVNHTNSALDTRKSGSERLKAGAFAAGNIALNFIPIGKLGKIGGKAFKLAGGAKVLQRVRNATLIGAEVKAGTKIIHYTTAEAAEKIAASGLLKGSERGFLSMGGKKASLELTQKGLQRTVQNNGQIYAVAADGGSSALGKVIDVIVGVGGDTKVGKLLAKVEKGKTAYSHAVEMTLTAEMAKNARRYGKTIVTNVPAHLKGLAMGADDVVKQVGQVVPKKAVGGVVGTLGHKAERALGKTLEVGFNNLDWAAFGVIRAGQSLRQ